MDWWIDGLMERWMRFTYDIDRLLMDYWITNAIAVETAFQLKF